MLKNDSIYALAAASSAKDLIDRKYYRGEFYRFDPAHSMEKITQDDKLKKSHSKRSLHNIPSSHKSDDDIGISLSITTNIQSDSTNRLQESSNMNYIGERIMSSKPTITYNRSSETGLNCISFKFNYFSPFSSAKGI
ncbi:hypothetical protein RhiirC2_779694 [Rhizophagus irregularis]|uniref:Uncharacterized protein n=1 Tax=Rhizophagus irregularis TaxID=588596 RepID=A0A2N1N9B1_9GLOM|nr:hypothetical protein RhiirC2_779694 [Rhizophagus irregularis]